MSFVIRSMSTTDYVRAGYGRPEQKPEPYHVYLMPAHKRGGAWWTRSSFDAQVFATEAEAQAEFDRLFAETEWYAQPQVAPLNASGVPTFWEFQKERAAKHTEFAGYSRAS